MSWSAWDFPGFSSESPVSWEGPGHWAAGPWRGNSEKPSTAAVPDLFGTRGRFPWIGGGGHGFGMIQGHYIYCAHYFYY